MSKPNFIYYLFKRDETVFELNQFADLTSAEFKQKILMKEACLVCIKTNI